MRFYSTGKQIWAFAQTVFKTVGLFWSLHNSQICSSPARVLLSCICEKLQILVLIQNKKKDHKDALSKPTRTKLGSWKQVCEFPLHVVVLAELKNFCYVYTYPPCLCIAANCATIAEIQIQIENRFNHIMCYIMYPPLCHRIPSKIFMRNNNKMDLDRITLGSLFN